MLGTARETSVLGPSCPNAYAFTYDAYVR